MIQSFRNSWNGYASGVAALGLLLGSAGSSVLAQADTASPEPDPALWSISYEDSTVYLFGDMPVLPSGLEWRTEKVSHALAASSTVYLQIDTVTQRTRMLATNLPNRLGRNEEGIELSALLSEEALSNLEILTERYGYPEGRLASFYAPFKPWFVTRNIFVLSIRDGGYRFDGGSEQDLYLQAAEDEKSFEYLDTLDQWFHYLNAMPMDQQVASLEQLVNRGANNPDLFDQQIDAWLRGDLAQIDQTFNADLRNEAPDVFEYLIAERNRDYVPQIEAALAKREDVLMIIEIQYFTGEGGLISMLEDQGHSVVRQ